MRKCTHIKLNEDQFKTVTATLNGHNLDTMAFNVSLMMKHGHGDLIKMLQAIYETLPLYEELKDGRK